MKKEGDQKDQQAPGFGFNGFAPGFTAASYSPHYYQNQPGSQPSQPHPTSNPAYQPQQQQQQQQQFFQFQQQQQQFQPAQYNQPTQQPRMSQAHTSQQGASSMYPPGPQFQSNPAQQQQRGDRFSMEYPQAKGQPKQVPNIHRPVVPTMHDRQLHATQQSTAIVSPKPLATTIQGPPVSAQEPVVIVKTRRTRTKVVVPVISLETSDHEASEGDSADNEMNENAIINHKQTMEQLERLNKRNYGNYSDRRFDSIFERKMIAFKVSIDMIQKGTDPEYLDQLSLLKTERDEIIECAFLFKQHQTEIAHALCKAEIEQCTEEYKVERDGLRAKIQASLDERKRKILLDRDQFEITNDDKIQAATRSKITRVATVKADEKKERKRKGANVLSGLKDHEIYEDVDIFRKLSSNQPQGMGSRVGKAVKR